jgi:pilus assembly protein Flp/PilA
MPLAYGQRNQPTAGSAIYSRRIEMTNRLWMLSVKIQNLLSREEGQDLVEYALIIALISLAAITGMGTLAKDINNAFNAIGSTLSTSV